MCVKTAMDGACSYRNPQQLVGLGFFAHGIEAGGQEKKVAGGNSRRYRVIL